MLLLSPSFFSLFWIAAYMKAAVGVQECYVCVAKVGGSPEVEHQFPGETLPQCAKGQMPPSKQCPEQYVGCLTQFAGAVVQRSCGMSNVEGCNKANEISYCYCASNLCNNREDEASAGETTVATALSAAGVAYLSPATLFSSFISLVLREGFIVNPI